ncbi:MAG: preprotein translocase subunit SecG [Chitinophagaceae bacterium]|nr:preprotein translocase subunit SecG [Chitinophagaceae bacterium]
MTILFIILVILASALLGFVVLVQNPKGGGLSGSIGGFNTQFMGVKQTTDVLEKGTWLFAAIVGLLCLFSTLFIGGTSTTKSAPSNLEQVPTNGPVSRPAQPTPAPPAQQK